MAGIDNIRSGQMMTTTSRTPTRNDSNATSTTESKKAPAQQDAVSLSQQSKAVSKLQKDMAASPAYDSAKVAAIKEAITNGSYKVDPEKLADNMIKFENELQGKS
ncbi:flagellar biosynthesis anti-sigma factor FlgM [Vibrio alginolyticus]|uniref:flagellar biosynthesis anti-sigma factor FlgM n=1 Tax=Vibrio alginolyticus TaxID=663 RepID=UPI00079B8936|nr:flagellar biosynthesis anti-sigma factor FlgM [Vibrio alginolyticus]KXZ35304.1 flagellar biosynthesis anti-sigma factor FlgM [Vibrio alginolyticus]MBT0045692.1 flagellar biosynthesis anti-sigma factor FlgM [Vibrio alginolyticus]